MNKNKSLIMAAIAISALASMTTHAQSKAPVKMSCVASVETINAYKKVQTLDFPVQNLKLSLRNDGTNFWSAEGELPLNLSYNVAYKITFAPGKSQLVKGADLLVVKATFVRRDYTIAAVGLRMASSDQILTLTDVERIKKGELFANVNVENPEIVTAIEKSGKMMSIDQAFAQGVVSSGTPISLGFICSATKEAP